MSFIKFNNMPGCSHKLKTKPVEENLPKADKAVVVKILEPCEHLKEAFSHELPLACENMQVCVKLYLKDANNSYYDEELKLWREVRGSSYFPFVPAVLPEAYDCSYRKQNFYGIVMEKAEGQHLDKWFDNMREQTESLPIVLHQFFSVWFQLFDLVKFLHEIPLYHTDFKPANIIFSNNSLHLIDFNIASSAPSLCLRCTTQYAPSTILEARTTKSQTLQNCESRPL